MMKFLTATGLALAALITLTAPLSVSAQEGATRLVAYGTLLDPDSVMADAQALARSLANPDAATWQAKGDQKRTYHFPEADATINYRIVIPPTWDGVAKLPMLVFLHSGFGNENTNLDANDGQLVRLAIEHGYALVSPMGHEGAYGNHLRLPAVFGQQAAADQQIAAITTTSERTNQLSEIDVMNVIEIILHEYPIDRSRMFLAGHSMGAGGTFYIGAKYPDYWAALAPLSGPFVHKQGYPWENIRHMPLFITEGDNTEGTASSRALYAYMEEEGFDVSFKEVVADHESMIPLVLPDVFAFFNENPKTVGIRPGRNAASPAGGVAGTALTARFGARMLRLTLPGRTHAAQATVSVFDAAGREVFHGTHPTAGGTVVVRGLSLPRGVYHAHVQTAAASGSARFAVVD